MKCKRNEMRKNQLWIICLKINHKYVKQLNYEKELCCNKLSTKLLFDCSFLLKKKFLPPLESVLEIHTICIVFLLLLGYFSFKNCWHNYWEGHLQNRKWVLDDVFCIPIAWKLLGLIVDQKFGGSYDSSISKRKKKDNMGKVHQESLEGIALCWMESRCHY